MAHFERFFSDTHSSYVKYDSFTFLEIIAKLHTCAKSLSLSFKTYQMGQFYETPMRQTYNLRLAVG